MVFISSDTVVVLVDFWRRCGGGVIDRWSDAKPLPLVGRFSVSAAGRLCLGDESFVLFAGRSISIMDIWW